jgi:hypothetical protein
MGTSMEEAAFTSILQRHIQHSPSLSLVHVPPQLLCSWAMLAERKGGGTSRADTAMLAWCQEHQQVLLGAAYVAFHWGKVWRCGPSSLRVVSPASALSQHEVPFLHLDTLPASCRMFDAADPRSMLLRICRVFNLLCNTTWSIDAAFWAAHIHVCGPPQQQDDWSCGYRLLRAWKLILQAGQPLTPSRCRDACASMAALPLGQLAQDTNAQYTDENEVSQQGDTKIARS